MPFLCAYTEEAPQQIMHFIWNQSRWQIMHFHMYRRGPMYIYFKGEKCIIAPGGPSGGCQKAHSEP